MSALSKSPTPTLFPFSPNKRGHHALFGLLAILVVLRVMAGVVLVPPFMAPALNLVLSAIFIAVPVLGLFYSANHDWTGREILVGLAVGVGAQVAFTNLAFQSGLNPLVKLSLAALAQSGLVLWCFCLGGGLSLLLKDKNLLLPVSLFLAGFDVFLVTYPLGPVQQVLSKQPELFQKLAYSVPKAVETTQSVGLQIGAYVGPADFIFLSMFFVALFKFKMRTRETLNWMVPALIAYLFVVLIFGSTQVGPISLGALPALLPIGFVVLAVNLPEFKMARDEWIGTVLVAAMAFGLAAFGISQAHRSKGRPVAPSPSSASQVEPSVPPTPAPTE